MSSLTVVELKAKRRQELERARMVIVRPVIVRLERHNIPAAQVGRMLGLTRDRMHRVLTGQIDAPAGFVGLACGAIERIIEERQQAREA